MADPERESDEVRLAELRLKEQALNADLEKQDRELAHQERLRSMELGVPIASAHETRLRVLGTIATLVSIAFAGAAAVSTVSLVRAASEPNQFTWTSKLIVTSLGLIWGASGLVSVLTCWLCIRRFSNARPEAGSRSLENQETIAMAVTQGSQQ